MGKGKIKERLFEVNKFERSRDEVTARAGAIMFAALFTALKVANMINKHMPEPGSNRGYEAEQYIKLLILMQ